MTSAFKTEHHTVSQQAPHDFDSIQKVFVREEVGGWGEGHMLEHSALTAAAAAAAEARLRGVSPD